MAHVRTQLRQAVKTALEAAGLTVYSDRGYDYDDNQLPVVEISTPDEQLSAEAMGDEADVMGQPTRVMLMRLIELEVLLIDSGHEGIDDEVDALSTVVEKTLGNSSSVKAVAKEVILTSTATTLSEAGGKRRMNHEMIFQAIVFTYEDDPETAI